MYKKCETCKEDPNTGGITFLLPGETNKYGTVFFDSAWTISPSANRVTPRSLVNFKGTVAHELMHVAIGRNPHIIEDYAAGERKWGRSDPLTAPIGRIYDWAQPGMTEVDRVNEWAALSVAAFMYERGAIGVRSIGSYRKPNWRYYFVGHAQMDQLEKWCGYEFGTYKR